jgi:DNA-directed RNA polymerase subunit M/transcription elongation factor TFIIS
MLRAIYRRTEYESVRYNPATQRWSLRPASGPDTVLLDPEFDDLEVECERCGSMRAYMWRTRSRDGDEPSGALGASSLLD